MLRSLLIANRGEIACRIARTAGAMGIRTVAVYSDADADAMHVGACDEAVRIGAPPATDSYLRDDRIIAAARSAGADAIHPGYGFLSENAAFAESCVKQGIAFVGPPAAAIAAMGSKRAAKSLMEQANVPLVPGYHGADQRDATLAAEAARIGYPVLLKASAGGGGRGMRVVESADAFAGALEAARREAAAAFGDDTMLLERCLIRPRHVEVQVFADRHGNFVHLFERDCSVQRRYQKVVEEAPAPGLEAGTRQALGAAAIAAARAVGYVGAGTVEFVLDEHGFYFIEMNTRLQVEHPVTEMITGIDLVEWQLRVAAGEALPLAQDAISCGGHAFEARLYAEDPVDFRPQTGKIHYLRLPPAPARIDTGIREGDSVSVHYDPLIMKLIVHGEDRDQALARVTAAIARIRVAGVATNQPFLSRLLSDADFVAGRVHTGLIAERGLAGETQPALVSDESLLLAGLTFIALDGRAAAEKRARSADPHSPWNDIGGWRLNEPAVVSMTLSVSGESRDITLHADGGGYVLAGTDLRGSGALDPSGYLRAVVGDRTVRLEAAAHADTITLFLPAGPMVVRRVDRHAISENRETIAGRMTAPMPGRITEMRVSAGDVVLRGTVLAVLEAMKMEHSIAAPADGTVTEVHYRAGDLVEEGAELLAFETGDVVEGRQETGCGG